MTTESESGIRDSNPRRSAWETPACPKRHANFRAKYDLKVVLGSDEAGEMLERYGVWVEKSMYGRKYMGIERATFLIDG